MADPEATAPPGTKADKILADLNRGEGMLALAAASVSARLAAHPHLALVCFIGWTVFSVWLGFKVGAR